MLGLKSKKITEIKEEAENAPELKTYAEDFSQEETTTALAVKDAETAVSEIPSELVFAEDVGITFSKPELSAENGETQGATEFARIADILNVGEKDVLEECKLFQIKKIMSYVEKAVVRYGVGGDEARVIIANALTAGYGGIAVSPAYLNSLTSNFKKNEEINICAVVDFPFGESSFKVKISEMKNAVKAGVDELLTVFPANLLKKESVKELKKQLKRIKKTCRIKKGVAVNAEDVENDDVKRFMRLTEKFDLDYVAFLFGNVTAEFLCEKMNNIIAHKNKLAVKVMANVEDVEGVKTLLALKADGIITPFAEKIAKELFDEFNITRAKLL